MWSGERVCAWKDTGKVVGVGLGVGGSGSEDGKGEKKKAGSSSWALVAVGGAHLRTQ